MNLYSLPKVSETSFPAHRYIVSHSSEILRDMINNVQANNNIHYVKIENIQPKVFERILYYLYTGECDFMKTGIYPVR